MSASIEKLTSLGQSLWYDNIQRRLLDTGELQAMIERGDVRGVTSNPTIFQNAIAKSSDYDAALIPLAWSGWDSERIFWQLAVEDIQRACDLFRPLYDATDAGDGYVSIEVSPYLARDTAGTVNQAQELWTRIDRPNLMIKIPATPEGIPAVRQVIAAGINVNVTLIFSLERYAAVMEAYFAGLEDRAAAGSPIHRLASVASFFVSRVDTKIDPRLPVDSPLRGQAAVANARLAYRSFEQVFFAPRFQALRQNHNARFQRPLWASTGTKNPAYSDTLYVDTLIGPHTVNTVPPATLDAFRDHGAADLTISDDLPAADRLFADLAAAGIDMQQVTLELEQEGVASFADAFTTLLSAIEARRQVAVSTIQPLSDAVAARLNQLERDAVVQRLWQHDPSLWTTDSAGQAEIRIRLGWLHSIEDARTRLPGYLAFAEQVYAAGIDRVLVIGMGGSSLTAEVLSALQAAAGIASRLSLAILDSTDSAQVALAARDFPPEKSLYIVASKSGGTAELLAALDYFWQRSGGDGSRFVVTTDAGSGLEKLARERNFRHVFNADPTVGGRFSALTDFGLVPAALMGFDLEKLLASAAAMQQVSHFTASPGVALGVLLGESALQGRDKLTILADPAVTAFAGWIEQVIAESTGKDGKGILPVPLEPLASPDQYGQDRIFVYLRDASAALAPQVALLHQAGFPVVEFPFTDPYQVGAEFFRWEIAVSIACHVLGINTFDQPDVQDSKLRTIAKIQDYQATGRLNDLHLVSGADARAAFQDFLKDAAPGEFFTINAYLPRNKDTESALQDLRVAIRACTACAVSAGFGPRFQHSTGQFHKGGPNKGRFIQVVYDANPDLEIPTQGMTFGTLIRAQALGDYEALIAAGRRVLRIRLSQLEELQNLL